MKRSNAVSNCESAHETSGMIKNHRTKPLSCSKIPPKDVLPTLEKATEFHRNGQKEEARRLYERVLYSFADHPDALHLLGVLENETGKHEKAVFLISAAIKSLPEQPLYYSNLGNAFRRLGKFEKAISCYQKSLEIAPDFHTASYNLAVTYRQNDQMENAEAIIKKVLERNPDWSEAWYLLGDMLNQSRSTDESIACFKRALEINPQLEQAWFYIGNAHRLKKELEKAVACYKRALDINPNFAECLNNLGIVLCQTGNVSQAVACYEKSIRLQTVSAEAHYNLGNALFVMSHGTRALACYQKALLLKPDFFEAMVAIGNIYYGDSEFQQALQWFNKSLSLCPLNYEVLEMIGNTLRSLGENNSALDFYRRSLKVKPDAHKVFVNIGNTHRALKNMDLAISSYRKALEFNPRSIPALNNLAIAFADAGKTEEAILTFDAMLTIRDDFATRVKKAMTLPIIYPSGNSMIESRNIFADNINRLGENGIFIKDPYHEIGMVNFILALHGLDEKPIREMIAAFYLKTCPDLSWSAAHLKRKKRRKKVKLGFVSRYLHNHTIGRLYRGIIEKIDKNKFELIIFHFEPHVDDISRSIDQCAETVVFLPLDIHKARRRIADHELDILFYPEIGMDPLTYYLAFARLAPVQCKRGFQVTMGIPNIDYFISSDAAEPPEAQQYYSETLIRLKGTGYFYYRPQKPDKVPDRASFGLPEERTLYACTQSLFKLHPDFDPVIAEVLEKDSQGVLVLVEGMHPQWKTLLMRRFERTIPNVCDRICFVPRLPRKAFLNLHRLADAVLDTIYFSGGHTSLECFAWGIPVVTWPGTMLPGRLTYGFYKQMCVMDCVAWDQTAYVNIAHRLANDHAWRHAVGQRILERSSILFENIDDVVELESFFENAVNAAYRKNKN